MWIGIGFSLAAFGSDLYTAIVLLAYNRWASIVEPVVPFFVSRWLFAGCIFFSILLLLIDLAIAMRIIRRRNISMAYTNTLARNYHSIKNYNHFCLFVRISKSRPFKESMAFFVFFAYHGWIRLIFAETPRQIINTATLVATLRQTSITEIATSSSLEAFTLGLMAFSLTIWAFSMAEFIMALLFTLPVYLNVQKLGASGLEEYCCVRVNKKLAQLLAKTQGSTSSNIKLRTFDINQEEIEEEDSSSISTIPIPPPPPRNQRNQRNLHKRAPSHHEDVDSETTAYWTVSPAGSNWPPGIPKPPHKRLASEALQQHPPLNSYRIPRKQVTVQGSPAYREASEPNSKRRSFRGLTQSRLLQHHYPPKQLAHSQSTEHLLQSQPSLASIRSQNSEPSQNIGFQQQQSVLGSTSYRGFTPITPQDMVSYNRSTFSDGLRPQPSLESLAVLPGTGWPQAAPAAQQYHHYYEQTAPPPLETAEAGESFRQIIPSVQVPGARNGA